MIELRILGPLHLGDPDGGEDVPILSQPRRLAVLCYLALSAPQGFVSRDQVAAVFWPESDEAHARNSLSQVLHGLRRALGADVISTRGNHEVGVSPQHLWCDAVAFDEAVNRRDFRGALELYRGDLLQGLHLVGTSKFDEWLEGHRRRLREAAAGAAWRRAGAHVDAGLLREARREAGRALDLVPTDESAVRGFLAALAEAGGAASAVDLYDRFRAKLRDELEMEPGPDTRRLARDIRLRALPPREGTGGVEGRVAVESPAEGASIAVLPFVNMSADPADEYLSDGITEEIINALTQLPGLRVAARTSSFTFKGRASDLGEVGRKLGVATVLSGSVRRSAGSLRVTARLADVADGFHRWSERYDCEMDDVFAVQDQITACVVDRLRPTLSPSPPVGGATSRPRDLEAYEQYLRGRHFLSRRGPGLRKAVECFRRAIGRDPDYAAAHVGVADTLALIGFWEGAAGRESFPKAKSAARTALELDPGSAEAHACLGFIALWHEWDWPGAERELQRARHLSPRCVEALLYHCQYVGFIRCDWGEAIRLLEHAHRLDPMSVAVSAIKGAHLIHSGQPAEALKVLDSARELAPGMTMLHWYRGLAYRRLGRSDESVAAMERALALGEGDPHVLGELVLALVESGREAKALALLDEGDLPRSQPLYAAMANALMERREPALRWLEDAYERRDPLLPTARWMPEFAPLSADPRFGKLLRQLALP
ncbi:MAG: BTAD domain-containing putative transcriptional regulator [Gemmatimonadota bacterium]